MRACCANYIKVLDNTTDLINFIDDIPQTILNETILINEIFKKYLLLNDPSLVLKFFSNFDVSQFDSNTWTYVIRAYNKTNSKVTNKKKKKISFIRTFPRKGIKKMFVSCKVCL